VLEAELQRDAAAHAVADHVRTLDLERIERGGSRPGEERRVVGGAERHRGVAEAGQVDRDRAEVARERGDGGEEGRLGGAQAVQQQHGIAAARMQRRDLTQLGAHAPQRQPLRALHPARGGEEADAEVQVVADLQLAAAERLHAASHVVGDPLPRRRVGGQARVRAVAVCWREPHQAMLDRRVPVAVAQQAQAQPCAAVRSVERARVEAVSERAQHFRSPMHGSGLTHLQTRVP